MSALASRRCLHHLSREAVARCPECGQYYCRECIAEHDDRVICASCLRKLTAAEEKPSHGRWHIWPVVQMVMGLFLAWVIFYCAGAKLTSLPAEFHDDRLWKATLFGEAGSADSEDE